MRFELTTSALARQRSTPELHPLKRLTPEGVKRSLRRRHEKYGYMYSSNF
jgi:hypothetical protein